MLGSKTVRVINLFILINLTCEKKTSIYVADIEVCFAMFREGQESLAETNKIIFFFFKSSRLMCRVSTRMCVIKCSTNQIIKCGAENGA